MHTKVQLTKLSKKHNLHQMWVNQYL